MNATADRYAVVGHPVAHSRSPFIHGRFAIQTGQNIEYDRIDASPEQFERSVRSFFAAGGCGLNVTVPHKESAARLVDTLTPRAADAGAVNTIERLDDGSLRGDNTDGVGLVTDLMQNHGYVLTGRRILLLGAGGAGRGVLGPLLDCAPASITIANRDANRARELARRFAARGTLLGGGFEIIEPAPYDLIVNATSASLSGQRLPLPAAAVGPLTIGYDMAYADGGTPFTHHIESLGAHRALQGYGMLVEQAAEAFFVWRGVRPATRAVLDALTNSAYPAR